MKPHYYFLTIVSFIFLTQCESIEGPPGPAGRDGRDGWNGQNGLDGEEGYVFEYDFSLIAPDYSALLALPDNFEMTDADVAMAFLLWEVTEDGTEVWRPLPETLYLDLGVLEYNFDFSKYDMLIYLDGTVDFNALGAIHTDGWVARVVIIPAQFAGRSSIDFSDYDALIKSFDLGEPIKM